MLSFPPISFGQRLNRKEFVELGNRTLTTSVFFIKDIFNLLVAHIVSFSAPVSPLRCCYSFNSVNHVICQAVDALDIDVTEGRGG